MLENNFSADISMTPTAALTGEFALPAAEANTNRVLVQERLAFRVGPVGMLIQSEAGREVVLPPPVSRLPHLPAWLVGVTNVRGMLLPVVDLANALDLARDLNAKSYLLICGGGENAIGFLVDGLPLPLNFEMNERMHGIPPHPAILTGHVRGAYERNHTVWLDLSSESFIRTLGEHITERR